MTFQKPSRPRLPSHYYVWSEPPDESGDESLHFVSGRRTIKLKGHSFREFERRVIPLLDGKHTLEQIGRKVEDIFALCDLEAGLDLLASQNLLEDGPIDEATPDLGGRLTPQSNLFHELALDASEIQRRLHEAKVTVFGLSGAGAIVADGLAAAGVGTIRCLDSETVSAADVYLSSGFCASDIGMKRLSVVEHRLSSRSPATAFESDTSDLSSDEEVARAIEGTDFVICCLDIGQSGLIYKLNRACLKSDTRWISCTLSGSEVIVGPTVHPHTTACYLCYKMRIVACAGNPEDAFAFEKMLDRRKQDDSSVRENLVFGTGLAANMIALEALREVVGLSPVPTLGKVVIFDLLDMSSSKHVVLRKPWCPACFSAPSNPTKVESEILLDLERK